MKFSNAYRYVYRAAGAAYGVYQATRRGGRPPGRGGHTRFDFYSPLRLPQSQIFGFSQTNTTTEEEEETENSEMATRSSKSYLNVSTGNPKVKRVTRNSICYKDQYSLEMSWNSNIQQYTQVCTLASASQFGATSGPAITNRNEGSYRAWFDLNPLQGTTVGAITPQTAVPEADWMSAINSTVYFDFVNLTNMACCFKIHWFRCRTDTDASVVEDYMTSQDANDMYNTSYIFPGGVGGIPVDGGNENEENWSDGTAVTYPFMNHTAYTNILSRTDVKTKWKKLKTKTVILSGGGTHRNVTTALLNCFQSKSKLSGVDSLRYPTGCLTCLIEVQGMATHVSSTGTTTYDGPTIAPGRLGLTITRKVNLKPLKAPNERFDLTYVAPGTTVTNAPVENVSLIGDTSINLDVGRVRL